VSRRGLNISREGESTTSLFQCCITLTVKKFLLMFRRRTSAQAAKALSATTLKSQTGAQVELTGGYGGLTISIFHLLGGGSVHARMSFSGLPSSRKMKSYWRECSGGLQGW